MREFTFIRSCGTLSDGVYHATIVLLLAEV
jgi:hypothetical protein